MKLANKDNLKNLIKRSLKNLNVNTTLNEIEASREFKEVRAELEDFLYKQVEKIMVTELVEQALLLTRKAETNPQIQFLIEKELTTVAPFPRFLIDVMVRLLSRAEQIAGQDALDTLQPGLTYRIVNTPYIRERVNKLFPQLNTTTAKQISQELEEAKDGFLTIQETIDYVLEKQREMIKNRSQLIAENEVANVAGATQNEVYRKSGVLVLKWVTSQDERVCPICQPLNGKVINVNGNWVGGKGIVGKYPPIHINCRCFVIPEERIGSQVWTGQ